MRDSGSSPWYRRALAAWIFALLCSVYLLVYSGTIITSDEAVMYATADSIAQRGEFTANQLFFSRYSIPGFLVNNEVRTSFEPLQPLLASLLVRMALALPHVGHIHLTLLFNVFVTALTAVMIMLLVEEMGYEPRVGAMCALIFGLCTIALPYSKLFFREPLAGLMLLSALFFLVKLFRRESIRYGIFCMLCLIAGYFAKEATIAAVPIFSVAFLATARVTPGLGRHLKAAAVAGLVALMGVGVLAAMLASRSDTAGFSLRTISALVSLPERLAAIDQYAPAMAGFFISPGKSFFVYSPIALVALFIFPRFSKQHRSEAFVVGATSLVMAAAYALTKPSIWWGGLNWGPRFLVPLASYSVIPLAPLVADLLQPGRRALKAAVAAVLALSAYVQVIGGTLDNMTYASAVNTIGADKWARSIWELQYSPPIWLVPLMTPDSWNFAWMRAFVEGGQIDWELLALNVLFIVASGLVVWWLIRRRDILTAREFAVGTICAVGLTGAVIGVMMLRIYDDPRYHGGADRLRLLSTLDEAALRGDVLVLNNHTLAPFVMNYNRSSINWFGLPLETELSARSRSLLDSISAKYTRIWLMLDHSPTTRAPHLVEDYLTANAYPVQAQTFSDYAQLMLFYTRTGHDNSVQHPLAVRFADLIGLDGYDLEGVDDAGRIARGNFLRLSLAWQPLRATTQNYIVFVQLLDADNRVVWQSDRQPANGTRPTSSWMLGQSVRDNYGLLIPSGWATGDYRLIAGLYSMPTQERLTVSGPSASPDGYAALTTLTVR